MNNLLKVAEFHKTYDLPILEKPTIPTPDRVDLRLDLIEEEVDELKEALLEKNIIKVADALGDLLYVTYGASLEFGIPINTVMDEIHRSNMSKLGKDGKPIYREDGKVLKGPKYFSPNIPSIIAAELGLYEY